MPQSASVAIVPDMFHTQISAPTVKRMKMASIAVHRGLGQVGDRAAVLVPDLGGHGSGHEHGNLNRPENRVVAVDEDRGAERDGQDRQRDERVDRVGLRGVRS